MTPYFVLLGAKDRKILLENAKHKCPRCKQHDSVQLTRFEHELVIFNKKFALHNHMDVLYNCKSCHWKNKALPDDDPCFEVTEKTNVDELLQLPGIFVGSNTMTSYDSSLNQQDTLHSVPSNSSSSRRPSSAPSWKKKNKGFLLKRKIS